MMRWFTQTKCFYHTDLTHFFRQMALFLCLAVYGCGAYLALECVRVREQRCKRMLCCGRSMNQYDPKASLETATFSLAFIDLSLSVFICSVLISFCCFFRSFIAHFLMFWLVVQYKSVLFCLLFSSRTFLESQET